MTQDEIIEMAREVGGSDVGGPGWTTWVGTQSTEFLERFAKLVAAKTLAQTQEPVPPPWWPAVENILNEYGLQAVDFVADFKQALAQTQEPLAHWSDCSVHSEPAHPKGECDCGGIVAVADYTALSDKYVALSDKYVALKAQRTWVGLTDEEVYEIYASVQEEVNKHWENGGTAMMFPPTLYKAIEAKLKELNT